MEERPRKVVYVQTYGVEVRKVDGDGALIGHFLDQAKDLGVRFLVCQPSLDLNGMSMDDVIDGVEMIGGAAFNELAVEADAVISF